MITRVVNSEGVSGITNSFNAEKKIIAQISALDAATTITIRVCRDPLGDECIATDTASNIFTGLTTATKGSACWALNCFVGVEENDQLYCFIKSNNGTFNLDYLEITWGSNR